MAYGLESQVFESDESAILHVIYSLVVPVATMSICIDHNQCVVVVHHSDTKYIIPNYYVYQVLGILR